MSHDAEDEALIVSQVRRVLRLPHHDAIENTLQWPIAHHHRNNASGISQQIRHPWNSYSSVTVTVVLHVPCEQPDIAL